MSSEILHVKLSAIAEAEKSRAQRDLSEQKGIAYYATPDSEKRRVLAEFEPFHRQYVLGQELASSRISTSLRQTFGFQPPKRKRPLCSFMFVGPTGTGKTETSKIIANRLFNDQLIHFDIGNFQTEDAAISFMGHGEGAKGARSELATRVAALPNPSFGYVLLLDEIEKGHKSLKEALLAMLDKPNFATNWRTEAEFAKKPESEVIDLSRVVVICTTNEGAAEASKAGKEFAPIIAQKMIAACRKAFRPEVMERFDETIPFCPLAIEDLTSISTDALAAITKEVYIPGLLNAGVPVHPTEFHIDSAVALLVAEKLNSPELGARAVRRVIRNSVGVAVEKLLDDVLSGAVQLPFPSADNRLSIVAMLRSSRIGASIGYKSAEELGDKFPEDEDFDEDLEALG